MTNIRIHMFIIPVWYKTHLKVEEFTVAPEDALRAAIRPSHFDNVDLEYKQKECEC